MIRAGGDDLGDALTVFAGVRPRLFGAAYRILGTVTEAEDILQEVWMRWQTYDRSSVRDAAAFLMTVTTRLSINELQSARVRRETYIGPWLPEPVDTSADPTLGAERAEALEFATLLVMERLSPAERAAYVLREAFDYPYQAIGNVLEVTDANARQLVTRARKHIASERQATVDFTQQQQLLTAFTAAAVDGDMAALERLLAEDVVSYTDGNGARHAARHPVTGGTTVAKFICAFSGRAFGDAELTPVVANGQPAMLVSHRDGSFETFVAATTGADGIAQLLWYRSEAKLTQFWPAPV